MLKIQINRQLFISYLSIASKSSGSNLDLPVLNSILISADSQKSSLRLTSTNLSQAVISTISAKVISPGNIAIPSKVVFEFLSSLTDETVIIEELKNLKLKISAKNHNSTIYLTDVSDYPELPSISSEHTLEVQSDNLRKAFLETSFAASKDDTRPVLSGVLFYSNQENSLTMVSTDSYRLAEKTIQVESKLEFNAKAIIPTQTIQDVLKIIGLQGYTNTMIHVEDDQISFVIGNVTMVSRLISGDYPEYRNLIPSSSDLNFYVDREELLQTVKIAAIFAKESAGTISLEVDKEDQLLKVNSVANQMGENHSQIAISTDSDGSININSRYLVDALNSFDEDILDIRFSKGLAPFIVSPHKSGEEGHLHLIMPINS